VILVVDNKMKFLIVTHFAKTTTAVSATAHITPLVLQTTFVFSMFTSFLKPGTPSNAFVLRHAPTVFASLTTYFLTVENEKRKHRDNDKLIAELQSEIAQMRKLRQDKQDTKHSST
jgi:hypothetical protein